ncbi:3249_t:CDS:2, partial [Scutellospora calospora]
YQIPFCQKIPLGTLPPEERNLPIFLNGKIISVMNSVLSFEEILEQELLWCLLCIKYPSTMDSVEHIKYLVNEIPKHPRFIKMLKQRTLKWLDDSTSENWQLKVATDKRVLYLHSSFCAALQSYIRIIVRKHIAKLLCTLERLSALKTLLNLECKNGDNNLIEYWYHTFNDNNVIDVEFMMDPKPDSYPLSSGPYTMEFPFSYYLIKQINLYEKLYIEDIKILKENKNNIDNSTGDLLNNILADCFERFQNILLKTPALQDAPLQIAGHLYYKDFLTIISSNNGGNENLKLITLLLQRRLGKKLIMNPIRLHTYWWAKSDIIIAELQLSKLCYPIANEIVKDINDNFENYKRDLPDIAAQLTLDRIHTINEKQLQQWQLEVPQILLLCTDLSVGPLSSSFQLLSICNDLVSLQVIPPNYFSIIIDIGRKYGPSDIKFVDHIFKILDTKRTTKSIIARQNFVLRILEIIPLESPARLHLYEKLFTQAQPLTLTAFIILCIFRSEEKDLFSAILGNTNKVFRSSRRLNIINEQLGKNSCDSELVALCCDVIQQEFFDKMGFDRLKGLFRDAFQ